MLFRSNAVETDSFLYENAPYYISLSFFKPKLSQIKKSKVVLIPAHGKIPKIGGSISHNGDKRKVVDIIGNVKKPYLVVK